ncbi:MAG: HU family DNA-binding protein [Phycisphaerales bacterium]
MATVSKKELIDRICAELSAPRTVVRSAIQSFLDQIVAELAKGNRLEFRDFGVFETKLRAARRAQNPRTLERVDVPPRRSVKFKVGHLMREALDRETPHPPSAGASAAEGSSASAPTSKSRRDPPSPPRLKSA